MSDSFKLYQFSTHLDGHIFGKDGKRIYDFSAAVKRALELFPEEKWEIYNGESSYRHDPGKHS